MAKYDELPVFKATYDLLLRIYMVSQHWSRDIRYTLGEELKKEVIEILQLIYQANASKKKIAFLSSCRVKLIKVRLQIRVAKDLKQLQASTRVSDGNLTVPSRACYVNSVTLLWRK